ncbi:hypothetical protein MBLNU457_g0195t1 [Dothideomycetes sp. NU457]
MMNNSIIGPSVEEISSNWEDVGRMSAIERLMEHIKRKESDMEAEHRVMKAARYQLELDRQEMAAYRDEVKTDLANIKAEREELKAEQEKFWAALEAMHVRQEAVNKQHEKVMWEHAVSQWSMDARMSGHEVAIDGCKRINANQKCINREHEVELEKIRAGLEAAQVKQEVVNEGHEKILLEHAACQWQQDARMARHEVYIEGHKRLSVVQARINRDQAKINHLGAVFQSKHI